MGAATTPFMNKNDAASVGYIRVRIALGLLLTTAGISLAVIGLTPHTLLHNTGPVLRADKLKLHPASGAT
jgi:hypothetical protein